MNLQPIDADYYSSLFFLSSTLIILSFWAYALHSEIKRLRRIK
jgi:hypothetical protein